MLICNFETKCWANSNRVKYLTCAWCVSTYYVCIPNADFPVNLNQINAKCAFTLTKSSSLNVVFSLKHYKLPKKNKGDIYSKLPCSMLIAHMYRTLYTFRKLFHVLAIGSVTKSNPISRHLERNNNKIWYRLSLHLADLLSITFSDWMNI